ncbi:phosphopentomutase [Clostridium sp.]|uniref:phosphopentomutase n=1 Tax=Clostridium sp. TaxID=1506 RepID=UPI002903DABE|nr:phosphopentomutase [Clostridium sp.]MDU3038222.1 phosphopentomutase [Clostridium sp.]
MKKYNRIFTIVIDSLGIGQMDDAKEYGDVNVDTLGHIAESVERFNIPNLQRLGISNLHPIKHVEKADKALGYAMKMAEASVGKDTMTGHWEMMGLHITKPFQTFTDTGFPKELLDELEKRTGHKIVGNKSASGTEILDELAEHQVGRVIARPYLGDKEHGFTRTSNRHDYALKPYGTTVLNVLKDSSYDVISVGKISDIFDGEGITESHKSKSSVHGMEQTLEIMDNDFKGLCFVNLVDFDALWGHRRNPKGYAEELEKFDINLGKVLDKLKEDDLLIITADHGNDPTYIGSDHTREYVPFIAYSPLMEGNGVLDTCDTFATIGATIADNFNLNMPENTIGKSILDKLQ